MINPRTYEQLAARLIAAGEKVSLGVGIALRKYWQQLIRDPNNINDAAYRIAVAREISKWNREAREWAKNELALAYIQGIEHADKELAMVQKLTGANLRQPVKLINPVSPLLPRLPLEAFREIATAAGIFDKYPDHRTFFGVYQRAAHYHLEGTDFQIMRASQDLAREAAVAAGDFLFRDGDIYTRQKFAQQMLNEFSKTGVKAIRYRNGRMVSIDAYAEMVGRS
ncbi:MAG TPA: hypothetical protein PK822_08705, partial [Bacillota bacterium]|nr:hypothetical protein [Bacillota bacterium]